MRWFRMKVRIGSPSISTGNRKCFTYLKINSFSFPQLLYTSVYFCLNIYVIFEKDSIHDVFSSPIISSSGNQGVGVLKSSKPLQRIWRDYHNTSSWLMRIYATVVVHVSLYALLTPSHWKAFLQSSTNQNAHIVNTASPPVLSSHWKSNRRRLCENSHHRL